MSDLIYTATGRNGSVELYKNRILIKKKLNALKRMLVSGDKEIYLDTITSVNFKNANKLTLGFIQFETKDNKGKLKKGSLLSGPNDEYSVIFTSKQQQVFEELKQKINELR